jgi:hypothetical protein
MANEKIEGVGAEWIQLHLDACDTEQRINVIDSLSMISDPHQHHHLKLTSLLDMFVTNIAGT